MDVLNWTIPVAQGSSHIEPGITPQNDIALAFPTWTDFEQTCGMSRLWGGVHFYPSIPAGQDIGHEIGTMACDYVDALIKGSKNQPDVGLANPYP